MSVSAMPELPFWASEAPTPERYISPNSERSIKLLAQKKELEVKVGRKGEIRRLTGLLPRPARPPRDQAPSLCARCAGLRPRNRPGTWPGRSPYRSGRIGTSGSKRHRPRPIFFRDRSPAGPLIYVSCGTFRGIRWCPWKSHGKFRKKHKLKVQLGS